MARLVRFFLLMCICAALAQGVQAAAPGAAAPRAPPDARKLQPLDLEALANGLLERYFETVANATDVKGNPAAEAAALAAIRDLMDPSYQIMRADGTRDTKATYTPPDLGAYIIDDLNVTAPAADVIVARYTLEAPGEAQFGRLLGSSPQPRITAFLWDPDENDWKLVSHANYNSPIAVLCDPGPAKSADAAPPGRVAAQDDAATAALARAALRDHIALLLNGTAQLGSSPGVQIQYADGSGVTGRRDTGLPPDARASPRAGEYAEVKVNSSDITGLVATRHRDVMVASFYAHFEGLTRGGVPLTTPSQRLMTFVQDGGPLAGNWSVAALASYAYGPAREPPDAQACVQANASTRSGSGEGGGASGGAQAAASGGAAGLSRPAGAAALALAALAALAAAL